MRIHKTPTNPLAASEYLCFRQMRWFSWPLAQLWTLLILSSDLSLVESATVRVNERHSYSLSTFDPSGKIAQVEAATTASSLGTPIIAVCQPGCVLLASPQFLPSVFMKDDGTARFATVSPQIAIAHTGISADGRVLVAAAQRLAVEHAYTFDEAISIDVLLEEMSLLMQKYTMEPGARPFGASLIVAYLPKARNMGIGSRDDAIIPILYRIDPSGSITQLPSHVVLNGNFKSEELPRALKDLASDLKGSSEGRKSIADILIKAFRDMSLTKQDNQFRNMRIISASLTDDEGLIVQRITP